LSKPGYESNVRRLPHKLVQEQHDPLIDCRFSLDTFVKVVEEVRQFVSFQPDALAGRTLINFDARMLHKFVLDQTRSILRAGACAINASDIANGNRVKVSMVMFA
jgi:hypothetical protein